MLRSGPRPIRPLRAFIQIKRADGVANQRCGGACVPRQRLYSVGLLERLVRNLKIIFSLLPSLLPRGLLGVGDFEALAWR